MRRFAETIIYHLVIILVTTCALCFVTSAASSVQTAVRCDSPDVGGYVNKVIKEEEAAKRRVYLGGQAVGFSLDLKGVMVVEFNEVDTPAGHATLKSELRQGDIIQKINGVEIESSDDVVSAINQGSAHEFLISVMRGDEKLEFTVHPLIDRVSGEYRLGIGVKSEIGGIGTVTYVRQDGRFAALGHSVGGVGGCAEVSGGDVYGCKIIGVDKGQKGRAGSIKGVLEKNVHRGTVEKNTRYGIYGNLNDYKGKLFDISSRDQITCGRAQICSDVSGDLEFYDVEIIKTAYQSSDNEKGMVIKVTDKRLIRQTGGIIQGMSGSPILQNDKIVGAVTHVFVNDPLRGYGIYLDWMLKN